MRIASIWTDPNNASRALVLAGSVFDSNDNDSYVPTGTTWLLQTTNQGKSWTILSSGTESESVPKANGNNEGKDAKRLGLSTTHPRGVGELLQAVDVPNGQGAVTTHVFAGSIDGKVYRSTIGGLQANASWEVLPLYSNGQVNNAPIRDLALEDNGRLWVAATRPPAGAGGAFIGGGVFAFDNALTDTSAGMVDFSNARLQVEDLHIIGDRLYAAVPELADPNNANSAQGHGDILARDISGGTFSNGRR